MHACLTKQYHLHMVVLRTDWICEYMVDSFSIGNTKVHDQGVYVDLPGYMDMVVSR
jgi:hypothetical protein